MRQTLIHLDTELNTQEREQLCQALSRQGANGDLEPHSRKPKLMFVAYDERRIAPRDLVAVAQACGHRAQLVDL